MPERIAPRLLQLSEFDIAVVALKELRSHALSVLLAWFPSKEHEALYEDLAGEEVV